MKKIAALITTLALALSLNGYANDAAKDSLAIKKSYFQNAKKEIESMLDGKEPLSYERAIFLMENAYWENSVSYQQYQSALNDHTKNIIRIAKQNLDGLTDDYNPKFIFDAARQSHEQYKEAKRKLYLNWAIFKYMTDMPTYVNDNDTLKLTQPYRFKYSYKDPLGTKDWSNTQVINLLQNHQGNCFALASLYKIFADRLQTDAVLCTAPGHIYISHENEKGVPFNVELSNASFPGCGTMETLTYTTNEATINNIALRSLSLKQSVALCLVYLAEGYQYKFSTKDDAFMQQCAEDALKYDDHNLNAMLLKAEIFESRILAQKQTFTKLKSEKEFKEYENLIAHLYKLGYREMPLSMKNLLIKGWTKDSATYVIVKNNLPPKYNHSGITNTRYASLSWGLFDEEIPNKPVERFGRTIYNTKKKKIAKFDNAEVLYNDYNFDPVAFAWNVDPLAHKFPGQSPYSAFGDNPIFNVDVGGAYQYPAKLAAGYTKDYAMITKYLAENVQYDIKKSPIIQDAVTRNANGGYSKQDLIWKVAAWNNKESPTITFEEGLTKRTDGNARAQTMDQHNIHIDADYARSIDKILGSDKSSPEEKQSAILQFYQTLLDETTHTGDFKKNNGHSSGGEVGGAAVNEIYYNKQAKTSDGQVIDLYNPASDKEIYQQKTSEGKGEVLPTVPKK